MSRTITSRYPCKRVITSLGVSRFMESSNGASRNDIHALLILLFKSQIRYSSTKKNATTCV